MAEDSNAWVLQLKTYIRESKKSSELLISGFVREFEDNPSSPNEFNPSIPRCITSQIAKFNFVDMTTVSAVISKAEAIIDCGFKWFQTTQKTMVQCNWLLCAEMCNFFIVNYKEKRSRSFAARYMSLFYSILAQCNEGMLEVKDAEMYYELAIKKDPKNDIWKWNYGVFLRKESRYCEANVLIQKAIELKPRPMYLRGLKQNLQILNEKRVTNASNS
eukprot:70114_1